MSHRKTRHLGRGNHPADDDPTRGGRQKESDVQPSDERHQLGGLGVPDERRPVLRQPRQLDQKRRISAQRLGRGKCTTVLVGKTYRVLLK